MKIFHKISILIIVLFNLILLKIDYAQWVQVMNGLPQMGGSIRSLIVKDNYIFAGMLPAGIYATTNNGANWYETLNFGYIHSFVTDGNYIFAGTYPWGVLYTTNNGTNWFQTSLTNRTAYSLLSNGNNLFAGTIFYYGVYKSTNYGTSWTQTSLNNRNVYSLAVSGNNIYAGTADSGGVYRSTDNGESWTQTSLNNRSIMSLAVMGNIIFAGTDLYGVYISSNNGTNWLQTSLQNESVNSLIVFGNYIFAGTYPPNFFFISSDNGVNWIQKNEGLYSTVTSLCILNNYIFAGTTNYFVYRRPINEIVGIKPISGDLPKEFTLYQNYPNPFNPATKIAFNIPLLRGVDAEGRRGVLVKLVVFDALGREAATLVNEQLQPGTYEIEWDGSNYSSGVYFYTIQSENFTDSKRMILIK